MMTEISQKEYGETDTLLRILREILLVLILSLLTCTTAFIVCYVMGSLYSTRDGIIALILASMPHITILREKSSRDIARKMTWNTYWAESVLSSSIAALAFFSLVNDWYPVMYILFTYLGLVATVVCAIVVRLVQLGVPFPK